jgi:hypothetical protein
MTLPTELRAIVEALRNAGATEEMNAQLVERRSRRILPQGGLNAWIRTYHIIAHHQQDEPR